MARVIVAGYIARYPLGWQAWSHLPYPLGLRALGHDVYFFEDAGWQGACYDPDQGLVGDDAAYGVRMLREWLSGFGLDGHWVFRDIHQTYYGLPRPAASEIIGQADILINLSGVTWFDGFERIPLRVFVDEDPPFTQVRAATDPDFWSLVESHQTRLSYAHNIGQPGCTVPTAGLVWQPFHNMVHLPEWPPQTDEPASAFTTLMSWTAYGPVDFAGTTYGAKSMSFPLVMALPAHTDQRLELAVGGDDVPVRELECHGWSIRSPLAVNRSLDDYRRYIQRSRGEFSVAKHGYVVTRSGWFSDRSAAYLASSRPVVLQDAGYGEWLPVGEGLLAYRTLDEAAEALAAVNADYARHRAAARALAEEYLDSRRVLAGLLARL